MQLGNSHPVSKMVLRSASRLYLVVPKKHKKRKYQLTYIYIYMIYISLTLSCRANLVVKIKSWGVFLKHNSYPSVTGLSLWIYVCRDVWVCAWVWVHSSVQPQLWSALICSAQFCLSQFGSVAATQCNLGPQSGAGKAEKKASTCFITIRHYIHMLQ